MQLLVQRSILQSREDKMLPPATELSQQYNNACREALSACTRTLQEMKDSGFMDPVKTEEAKEGFIASIRKALTEEIARQMLGPQNSVAG